MNAVCYHISFKLQRLQTPSKHQAKKGEMVKKISLKGHVGIQVRPGLLNDVVSNANIYSEQHDMEGWL
jgi:hypothetical protein